MRSITLTRANRKSRMSTTSAEGPSAGTKIRKGTVVLWIAQGLLAALFLFAGGMKLVSPLEALAQQSHLPGLFMKFIGAVEVLGALGLILPGIFRVQPRLTSLAACGLSIVMLGATAVTLAGEQARMAPIPFAIGLLSGFVGYERRQKMPYPDPSRASMLQSAS